MEKDFDGWNSDKKVLNLNATKRFCHSREIWWCALGVNIGFEQDGTGEYFDRPMIVVRRFNENIFLGAALTGKKKEGKFYFPIGLVEGREASVILSQIRLIDARRLMRKMAVIGEEIFQELKNALKRTLFD
jgi:mRNA interferase MazF